MLRPALLLALAMVGADPSVQRPGVSEVVSIPTMGGFAPANVPPQTNCAHLQSGLQTLALSSNVGGNLVIPEGAKMLLSPASFSGFSGVLNRLTVSTGSSLILDDKPMDLQLRELVVREGGQLIAGTASCRLLSSISITFHGDKTSSSSAMDPSSSSSIIDTTVPSKGLLVYGEVSMFGKYHAPTWTRLATTAKQGASTLRLQERVNWEVGQTLLVTTTHSLDCPPEWASYCSNRPHQNEVRTITSVSNDDATQMYVIGLDQPLVYAHYGGFEYQAEVALLSRNILLRGSQTNDFFGGHTKVIGTGALGRFSGVQADNMGQLNVNGRYPFHQHLLLESPGASASFFEDCSVTNSNFRCYVVHGTNNTRLSRNVAYNAKGSCFYFEDGVEERSMVEYNLAAFVSPIYRPAGGGWSGETFTSIPGQLLQASDTSAAGFYFLNANNDIIGNAASGGWVGFAFPNAPLRLGAFANTLAPNIARQPLNRPLKKFYGNTAHSAGFYWGDHGSCVYVGAKLTQSGSVFTYYSGRQDRNTISDDWKIENHLFENNKLFLCNKGVAHWGNDAHIDKAEMHDCAISAMLFGEASMHNALVNMVTANPDGRSTMYSKYGFQFYDTWVKTILSDVTFRNVSSVSASTCAIRYMDHSDKYTPQGINGVRGLHFQNMDYKYRVCIDNCGPTCGDTYATMSSKMYAVMDYDGSMLDTGGPTIVGSNLAWWSDEFNTCSFTSANVWTCPWTFKPWGVVNPTAPNDRTVVYMNVMVPGLMFDWNTACDNSKFPTCSDQYLPYNVARISHWGDSSKYLDLKASLGGLAGLSNAGWYLRIKAPDFGIDGAPSTFYTDIVQMPRESFIVLAVAYPPSTKFVVTVLSKWGNTVYTVPYSTTLLGVIQPTEIMKPESEFICPQWPIPNAWDRPCNNTGGSGVTWHFDGNLLYLRIINFNCLMKRNCANDLYEAFGCKVGDIYLGSKILVEASCDTCQIQSTYQGVKYFTVADVPPTKSLRNTYKALTSTPSTPSRSPSSRPLSPAPSKRPILTPSASPSVRPLSTPSNLPSRSPSAAPSQLPSKKPSKRPRTKKPSTRRPSSKTPAV